MLRFVVFALGGSSFVDEAVIYVASNSRCHLEEAISEARLMLLFNAMDQTHLGFVYLIIFCALAPYIVAVLDFMFLGREYPSTRSWMGLSLSLIVLGAYGYALTDSQFEIQEYSAYFWSTLYCAVISF